MKRYRWFSGLTFMLMLVLCFGQAGSRVIAADRYWDAGGGVDTDWSNTNNWTENIEPTVSDNAHVGHTSGETDASAGITQTGEACTNLYVGYNAGTTGTITMTGGYLTVANILDVGNYGQGTFIQDAGTNTVTVYLCCGVWASGNGTYTLGGGKLNAPLMYVGNWGSGTFQLNAGELELTGSLYMGYVAGSTGTFTQVGGKVNVTNGYIEIAYGSSASSYTMSGGNLTTKRLNVGVSGQGTFIQDAGTNTMTEYLCCAFNPSSSGIYTLGGGKLNAPAMYIGNKGSGTLELNADEVDVTGGLYVGCTSGSTGTITIAGGRLNMTDYYVRQNSGAVATLRGWGSIKPTGSFYMNGATIADGYGTDNTLSITNYSSLVNNIANGASETNGWYARNHGKLMLNDIAVAGDGTKYWGDTAAPDLVNAVQLDLTGVSGSGALSGVLHALDHGDVPEYGKSSKITAIWKFETNNFSFGSADITFRYDHAKATELGIAESDLKVYHHPAGKWRQITPYSVDTNANTITASNVVSFSYFAVGQDIKSPVKGTVFMTD